MNEKNLDYLKDQLKYLGFGENLHRDLEHAIQKGDKEFTMELSTQINHRPFSAQLHFRKAENSDHYFFNKWEGKITSDVGKEQQSFYINKGSGVTVKEGFNLLEGRAVHKELTDKEGQKYAAWLQLNKQERDLQGNYKVHQYHQNYGYDLEKVLQALPLKELSDPVQKQALMKSLEKGNVQAVTFEKNGFAEKLFLEAAPRFKSLNVYDHEGRKIPMETLEKRWDFHRGRKESTEVEMLGKARGPQNGREVEGTSGKELKEEKKEGQGKKQGQDQTRDLEKENPSKKNTAKTVKDLLPKREGDNNKKGLNV